VIVRGHSTACSKQEFDVLYALTSSPGIVFTRHDLLTRYWPHASRTDVRLVDPIVSRLRRKIEREPDAPQLILTVWGVGYKFAEF
jgi:two-component system response regulator ResD